MINATGSGTKEEVKLSATAERFCRRFSLPEIQLATQDFSEAHLIGIGGFGKVYKGLIDDGKETVAMKRLAPTSNQGKGEFLAEIETLSKLRHVNLVSLIGYCNENGEMILVYEYIARGTLADHLYKLSRSSTESEDCSPLSWKQCLNLCIGAGRGLDYLHTGASIVHRDVKSTNILLDENLTAKVSDFGLAKHFTSNSKSHVSTIVKGTFGYLDPSYFITCRLTRKSDTYAFGVVLLEVLCGRPAVDQRLGEDEISDDCLKTFVGITKRCLNREPKKRPTMAQVVVQLEFSLEQHKDKKAPTPNAFLPFWNRFKSSGSCATVSTQNDHKQGDVHTLPTAISIDELKEITNNFSSKYLICQGFNGNVYRGALKCGHVAAIKKVRDSHRNHMPEEEFLEQVSLVSSLKHENVAQLLGYCLDGGQRYLAYEFAPNGSLQDIIDGKLGGNGSKPVVSWAQRVEIAIGAAKGLEYIHQQERGHYNMRCTNILLFDNYKVAKLTYFGHSTEYFFGSGYHPEVRPYEYPPPEYLRGVELSWRGDVFRFGNVLFQLIMSHISPRGERNLLNRATSWLAEHGVKKFVDARLIGDYPPKAVEEMARISGLCKQDEPESRPDMSMVLRALNDLAKQPAHLGLMNCDKGKMNESRCSEER